MKNQYGQYSMNIEEQGLSRADMVISGFAELDRHVLRRLLSIQ